MPRPDSDQPPTAARSARRVPVSVLASGGLAWLGAVICSLLLQRHTGVRAFLCPVAGGCETVLRSRFAVLAGIPLPVLGLIFYLSVLALLLVGCGVRSTGWRVRLMEAALWVSVAGVTFSAGLMVLQFGVLQAFCPLCTASAVVMGGLVVALLRAARAAADWSGSQVWAIGLALGALLSSGILLLPGGADSRPQQIDLAAAHLSGPRDARVRMVVFSDFQCRFCREVAPALQRVRARFPRDLAFAFRHYPLDLHPRALPAAIAAECAAEQDAFWAYHDKLFAEGGDLSDAKLLALATTLGLDSGRFAECLKSGKPKARVEASRRDALAIGLEGAPAVFLNGRRVEGALTFENLTREIEALLRQPE